MGLEPVRLSTPVPQTGASANFATSAWSPRLELNQRPPSYQDGVLPLNYEGEILVRRQGLEPQTIRLKVGHSSQLSYRRNVVILEPTAGIEPAFSAWKADVLPLNYIDSVATDLVRGLNLYVGLNGCYFVGVEGFEPPTSSLSVTCSNQLSHTPS